MKHRALPILLAVAVAAAALAVSSPTHAGERGGKRLKRQIEKLDLDPATMERVDAILDASKEKRQESRNATKAEYEKMRSLLEQDEPDEAAVLLQADRIGEIKTERYKDMLRTLLQVRALLTPEQRAKLTELMDMKHRKGHRWSEEGKGPEEG